MSQARTLVGIDRQALVARHPLVVDLALATAVAVVPLVVEATDARQLGATLDPIDVASSAAAFALIVARRRAPLAVLVVALVAAVWSQVPSDDQIVLQVAAFLALYTVASTSSRKVAWTAGTVAAAALFVTASIVTPGPGVDGESIEPVAWMMVATAAGDAVRSRRAYRTAERERALALEERAERAEQALEEEARRQVVEERLRIARELHDVVAHHIAVINVQAGVAGHLLRDDPAGAEEALAHVRAGAASVLDEMSDLLRVLRRPDEPTSSVDPVPTLDQLERLVEGFTMAGLEVEWHTAGARRAVPAAVDLAAYRIVQEALTNAHRHGRDDRAVLRVDYEPHALRVEVVNASASAGGVGGHPGHGIVGMRERVAATGGTLDIGPTADGRFRVHATLPVHGADGEER